MSRLLVLTVVAAEFLDAFTRMLLPPGAEANVLIAHLQAPAAWTAKLLLLVVILSLTHGLPRAKSERGWPVNWTSARTVAVNGWMPEVLALLAISAGMLGAGSNASVLLAVR